MIYLSLHVSIYANLCDCQAMLCMMITAIYIHVHPCKIKLSIYQSTYLYIKSVIEVLTHSIHVCHDGALLMGPCHYNWTWLYILKQFTHKVTNLLWVWRAKNWGYGWIKILLTALHICSWARIKKNYCTSYI